ncbi:cysteine desulfurase-like protein [Amycolatopsis jejuensis]|uniref:cysteine desulfurase-like protein n=1 Tax=Amycolatopsis jejuensis TaxID=330084 RepID=UPI0005248926|nr:cysteine desulfurase-like protein [Amycolatopsis jejuensis]
MSLPVNEIRDRFPALRRHVNDRPVVYFDGPSGAQVPGTVAEAMRSYLLTTNANALGAFVTSRETEAIYDEARRAAADFTGSDPGEIAFGANMTTLSYALTRAVGRTLKPGDEIITTELEHEGNVSPWLQIAKDFGLAVRTVPLRREDATLDMDAYAALLGDRTRVVAFTLASNAFGSKTDVRRITGLAHEAGALAWGDAVHFAPHERIDRRAFGLDVLLCSPYKFFGPHLGLAAIDRELATTLPADRVRPAAENPPGHRFETGTQPHEAIAGFVAAVDYLAGLGKGPDRRRRLDDAYARIGAHERELSAHALRRMASIKGLKVYGITDPDRAGERTPTFSFTLPHRSPAQVAEQLGEQGIFTSAGNLYAFNASLAYGREEAGGWTRAGFLHYTTRSEVDRFCDAITEIAGHP